VSDDPSLVTANIPSTTAAMPVAESCVPSSLPLPDISNVQTVSASTSTTSNSAVHTSLKSTCNQISCSNLVEASTKNTLYGKVLVLDGCFNNLSGRDEVKKLIKSQGGEVRTNLSINANYVLQGSNPKKKSSKMHSDVQFIDWKAFQKLLADNQVDATKEKYHDIALDNPSLATTSVATKTTAPSVAEPKVPPSRPLSHVLHANAVSTATNAQSNSAVRLPLKSTCSQNSCSTLVRVLTKPTAATKTTSCAAGVHCGMPEDTPLINAVTGLVGHHCMNCSKPMHGILCGALWAHRGDECIRKEEELSDRGKQHKDSDQAVICYMCMKRL